MSDPAIRFSLADERFDTHALSEELGDPTAGARVMFDGRVRNHNEGSAVDRLEYQAYPAMVEKVGQKILEEEVAKHGLLRARAVHRTGELQIGESAVWVGVASAHRAAAFDGARSIMERLKYELPVWKKEVYSDGRTEWVGPDNRSAETGKPKVETSNDDLPEWEAELLAIYISHGHDFFGRHGAGRLQHGITEVQKIECVAGMGLRGDRYFGYRPDYKGQVTFFEADIVDEVRENFKLPKLPASVFRRNLIVRGVDLRDWMGKRFRFQGIEFEGSQECKPCYWMDRAVAPGAEEFLKGKFRGGLRAKILSGGTLSVG